MKAKDQPGGIVTIRLDNAALESPEILEATIVLVNLLAARAARDGEMLTGAPREPHA